MRAVAHGELGGGGGRVCPDEGKRRERVSRQMEGSLVALHLMHLSMLCSVSFQSAKGRNHAFITQIIV